MKLFRLIASATIGIGLVLVPALQAHALSSTDAQIAHAMAAVPGGVQSSPNEVVWPDGSRLVVVGNDPWGPTPAAATACPTGKFCAYANTNGTGTRLEFTACPSSNSLAALEATLSIANARSSGTVTGRNGSTIVVTAAAGTTKNVTKTIDKLVCA